MLQWAACRSKPRQHACSGSWDLLCSDTPRTASIDRLHAALHALPHLSLSTMHLRAWTLTSPYCFLLKAIAGL